MIHPTDTSVIARALIDKGILTKEELYQARSDCIYILNEHMRKGMEEHGYIPSDSVKKEIGGQD